MKKILLPKERLYGLFISAKFSFSCNAIFISSCIFLHFSGSNFFGTGVIAAERYMPVSGRTMNWLWLLQPRVFLSMFAETDGSR